MSVTLVTFHVLSNHEWLVATALDSADIEEDYYCTKFCCTGLDSD